MRAIQIAAIIGFSACSALTSVVDAAEAFHGHIRASYPAVRPHAKAKSPDCSHELKVRMVTGDVSYVHPTSGETHSVQAGDTIPSGSTVVSGARGSFCHIGWHGASVMLASKSVVILNPDLHEVKVSSGVLQFSFSKTNSEVYQIATKYSSLLVDRATGRAIALLHSDNIQFTE